MDIVSTVLVLEVLSVGTMNDEAKEKMAHHTEMRGFGV